MAHKRMVRKLRAILSADVKGYSRLMGQDDAHTVRTIMAYREIMAKTVEKYTGRVVDSPGDNILAEFGSAVDAVECAVEVQKRIKEKNADLAEDRQMIFRIGINLGDVIQEGKAIYGDGVNIAARIEGLADPGGVSVSRSVYNQVNNKLPFGYADQGEHSVKNIKNPVQVYRVLTKPDEAHLTVPYKSQTTERWPWMGAIVVLLVSSIVAWAIYQYQTKPEFEPASVDKMAYSLPDKPSIAVLPFDNMSEDPGKEYISDGITEDIITSLSKTNQLFVIARNSTFTYKGKPVKIKQVAEELGVRYVLEGSVRVHGDRLRVTAQLIDAISAHHLWAERYDRDLKDIFALQDEITMKIVTALRVELTDGESTRMFVTKIGSLDLYLKQMEVMSLWNKGDMESHQRYGQVSQEIIDMAPDEARGYRALGWYYWGLALSGISPKTSVLKAYKLAKKTLAIDETDPLSITLMGSVLLMMRQHEKAIAAGERAVALNPNGAFNIGLLGVTLSYSDRPDDGLEYLEQMIRLDPYPPYWCYFAIGRCNLVKGQYEKALAGYSKSLQAAPGNLIGLVGITVSQSLLGRKLEARESAKKILTLYPNYTVDQVGLSPFKNPAHIKLVEDELRKAGLPEKQTAVIQDKTVKKVRADTGEMPKSDTIYNLNGDWDAIYDLKEYGVSKDIVSITRKGNEFVGIKLIGSQWVPKGSETIKGDIENNRIKSMQLKNSQGWAPAEWRKNEQGNEILLKQHMDSIGLTIDVKLTRK